MRNIFIVESDVIYVYVLFSFNRTKVVVPKICDFLELKPPYKRYEIVPAIVILSSRGA